MSVPQTIRELVERFERQRDAYRSPHYNETQLRREFLDPFFKALGWDIDNEQGYAEAYKDVIHEDAIKVGEATKAPDYCFRIGGARKFFLEAKKPAVDIQHDVSPAFQLRRYAWTTKLPLSVLSDFEEFAVYDCRFKPDQRDQAAAARVLYISCAEYAARWEEIAGIFSRDAVLKGAFDKFAEFTKAKRGTADVDDEFLKTIEGWRADLARHLALRNPQVTQRELNFAVQRIIDRIIFLRICEGRGLEDYGRLQALTNGGRIYPRLCEIFAQADARYNSGLFHFQPEKARHEAPDELTLGLDLDDKLLRDILQGLYYPECPYVFSALPADILGQVYEQFLGKVIRLTEGHRAVVEEKPEVKKAGGVYYTPTYIVDYIVQNTVGKLLEEIAGERSADFSPLPRAKLDAPAETPDASEGRELKRTEVRAPSAPDARRATALLNRVSKLRILDPACGSGSFLLGAYEFLLKWHLDFYAKNDPVRWAKGNKPVLVQVSGGSWRLTIAERKRILLDNIYGVDIDAQAVETTKLSLLLKVLEGETQQSLQPVLRMFQERALPDLGDNLKCGNSLIGPDFYQELVRTDSTPSQISSDKTGKSHGRGGTRPYQPPLFALTEEERYRINVFDWHAEFPHIFGRKSFAGELRETPAASPLDFGMPGVPLHGSYSYKKKKGEKAMPPPVPIESEWEGGFDAVIGNPPYLFITELEHWEKEYFGRAFSTCEYRFDVYGLFCERAVKELLRPGGQLSFIIPHTLLSNDSFTKLRGLLLSKTHLRQVIDIGPGVFQTARNETMVFVAETLSRNRKPPWICEVVLTSADKFPSPQRQFSINQQDWASNSKAAWEVKIGGSDAKILAKIQKQPTKLGDHCTINQGLRTGDNEKYLSSKKSSSVWKPAAGGKEVGRYEALPRGLFVYYEPSLLDAPRKREIFESGEKLVVQEIRNITLKRRIVAAYDADQFFCLQSTNVINLKPGASASWKIKFLLGVLNSSLVNFFFRLRFSGNNHIASNQLAQVPVPSAGKSRRDQMVKLVEQMLELHQRLSAAKTPQEQTSQERQIAATDTQIDRLVYDLYGLTEEEITIVEDTV